MSDETLYLYTSLTAGSSHIITATSRIETILKANKIPFKAIDIATHEKGRLIWQRRSKGRKIPGLVKYNDVVADLEQIEEWNEHGELEDQLDELIDIFGDVPVSSTSAEAQAAAQARADATKAMQNKSPEPQTQTRTSNQARHISISEPKGGRKESNPAATLTQDTPMSLAMKKAGEEAAAKVNQKKSDSVAAIRAASVKDEDSTSKEVPAPATNATAAAAGDADEPTIENTGARTPATLAEEGKVKTVEKAMEETDSDTTKSNEQQILSQERKASVPNAPSRLAQSTSIDEAHTLDEEDDALGGATEKRGTADAGLAKQVGATDAEEKKVVGDVHPQNQNTADADQAGVSVGD